MKKPKNVTRRNKLRFLTPFFILTVLLFAQCGTTGSSASGPVINSEEVRDYVCIVNRHLHPNMERYLNDEIRRLMATGTEEDDTYARALELVKRFGSGSGFVYVDDNGNNFILTNYHVIVGAYRLSVTFEDMYGNTTVYKNLYVHNVDEQGDLAILAFPNGERPFRRGIPFYGMPVRDTLAVSAAGYPGTDAGFSVEWNHYFGNIGNPRVTLPGFEGHFIRHNADINPGNSGGPLLVADNNSHVGFSVVGMNTLQNAGVAGANYAIPIDRIEAFVQSSFTQEDDRVVLENRLAAFMEMLEKATTATVIYQDISPFLSSSMINADPLNTVSTNRNDLIQQELRDDPVAGMAFAVAYNKIENPIWQRHRGPLAQTNQRPEVLSIEPNNMGGYTVRLLIYGYPYKTEWIKDYGTWKLDDFAEDTGEYNDYFELASPHPLGKKVVYSLSSFRDYDWYALEIPTAGRLTVRTEGDITDPRLTLYDTLLNNISDNDDFPGRGLNAQVSGDVRAGTVYIMVRNAGSTGGEYILLAGLGDQLDNIPLTAPTNPSITIVNNTGYTVWYVYIRPAGTSAWGQDRLAANQILASRASVSVQLPFPISQVSRYDIRLRDSDGETYTKTNVTVTANGRIVFEERDWDGGR